MGSVVKSMFNEIFGGGLFDGVKNSLIINPQSKYPEVWGFVENVYNNYMVPIALGIMLIWFLVAFIQKSATENVTFESLFLAFTKLIVAKFLIEHGLEIFTMLWSFGIASINTLSKLGLNASSSGSSIISNSTLQDIWKELTGSSNLNNEPGLFKSIGALFQLFVPWIVTWAMKIIVSFICYSRLIEMFLRMMAAPIALSDFMTEGLHGAGWKYLKAFFAIALQGVLIYLIAVIFSKLMASVFTGANGFMEVVTSYLVFGFSACALMFKSLSLSKELLGVN